MDESENYGIVRKSWEKVSGLGHRARLIGFLLFPLGTAIVPAVYATEGVIAIGRYLGKNRSGGTLHSRDKESDLADID